MGLVLALLGGVGMLASYSPAQEAQGDLVVVVELEDAIGPASASYFIDSLEEANERGATLLVLRLDTPGGLDAAMRDMIKAILASEVPVATWVAPSGARAASAGTYIMYASHFALMAAATNIGSSTPVNLTAPESPSPTPRRFPNWGGGDEADEEEESEDRPRRTIPKKQCRMPAMVRETAKMNLRKASLRKMTRRRSLNRVQPWSAR